MRLTKIVCTLGPATQSDEAIAELVESGMNIARLNFSHGNHKSHGALIERVRRIGEEHGVCIGVLLDTKGAEIRTGDTQQPFHIAKGEEVLFSPYPVEDAEHQVIEVNYDDFALDVAETDRILIDSGEMSFAIVSINDNGTVLASANEDGVIGSRRHINLPGADIDLPSITDKDWQDIAFGIEQGVDYIALSFIRTAEDVQQVRTYIEEQGVSTKIIAKIETRIAVEHLDSIIEAADGVMVARGDLGADVPLEEVPAIQDTIVEMSRDYGKPVIVATNMLESMIKHPVPTRAELTDIAHAVTTGADATMLSGETASGDYPAKSVETMHRVLQSTEDHLAISEVDLESSINDEYEARALTVVHYAYTALATAIIVCDPSGIAATCLSKARPSIPIIALSSTQEIRSALQLHYGVVPLLAEDCYSSEAYEYALEEALALGILEESDAVVVVSQHEVEALMTNIEVRGV